MIGFVSVTIASLFAGRTLASFGTVQPAQYAVDGIRVDFGDDGQIDVSSAAWTLEGQTSDESEDWAVQLTLSDDFEFSSWISTVDFQVNGKVVTHDDQGDLFFGFGDGAKYFTFGADFDEGINNGADKRGLLIYPACGGSLASGDVSTLLSNSKQYGSNAFYAVRNALAGGNKDNWHLIGGSGVYNGNDVWPVTIEVTNNVIANQATVRFISATQNLECVYDGLFQSDSDLVFGIDPDAGDDIININSVTVAKSEVDVCEGHCAADASAHSEYAPRMDYDGYRPEEESWTVELSGKDMLIVALCVVNVVVLMAVICSCSRFGAVGPQRKKYQRVSVNGDSEMEQFQN